MYATPEQADAYFQSHYGEDSEWFFIDDEEKPIFLTQATLALDSRYGATYRGEIFDQEQENLFPRTTFTDGDGRVVQEGTIPARLVNACSELALMAYQEADVYGADNRTGIQSESVSAGSVSTTVAYTNNGGFTDETGKVSVMIRPLLVGAYGSSFSFGTSIRG